MHKNDIVKVKAFTNVVKYVATLFPKNFGHKFTCSLF